MDLANGTIGPETKFDVAFSGGKLALTAAYQGTQAGLSMSGYVSGTALIDALKAKVTNPLELEAITVVEGIIAAIP